jgi:hypothetical protein
LLKELPGRMHDDHDALADGRRGTPHKGMYSSGSQKIERAPNRVKRTFGESGQSDVTRMAWAGLPPMRGAP